MQPLPATGKRSDGILLTEIVTGPIHIARAATEAAGAMMGNPMHEADLEPLLAGLPEEIGRLCRSLVALIESGAPLAGSIKLGWKSVNFRHDRAGHVCAVFPYADRVSIYFEHGRLLEDPDGLLEGAGLSRGRFLRLHPGDPVPEDAIVLMLAEAIALRA